MDQQQILTDLITGLKTDVINSMQSKGKYATGETVANLTDAVSNDYAALFAPWWIDALEVGRKPTSQGAQPGTPPMIDNIKAWCLAKGIPIGAAWAIKKNIDKVGYPGKPGVLTEPLSDDNVNARVNVACELISQIQGERVAELFNVFETA